MEMTITPLHFVSYSSLNTFHKCPRKLEDEKLGPETPNFSNPDLAFGSAIGEGIQKLCQGGTLEEAWLAAFQAWDCGLDEAYEKANKSFAHALHAIYVFQSYANILREEWEVYEYESPNKELRNAVELSARVDFPHGFVYRLYIDVVLRNKKTGKLLVLELKTTKNKRIDEAQYKNSNQGLGYGVILDAISKGYSEFDVWYYVYSSVNEDWDFFPFTKSRLDKAEWIKTVLYDTGNINKCIETDFFPKQGESCFDWFRQCEYYGSCGMSKKFRHAGPLTLAERAKKKAEEPFDFHFSAEELIQQQLDEIRKEVQVE
jgi:hypothetical protein